MHIIKRIGSIARFFYTQKIKGFPSPTVPMMDEISLERFRAEIGKCRFYLEFGSGGSTVEADRAKLAGISVENDPAYHKAVKAALHKNTQIVLCTVDIGATKGSGRPIFNKPTLRRVARWRRYVDAPFAIIAERGQFPDFVLVDARFRVACTLEVARQAIASKASTLIMLDDYQDRPHYHVLEKWLGPPERVGRTAFFRIIPETNEIPVALVQEHYSDWR